MDIDTLQQGLADIQGSPEELQEAVAQQPQPWLTKENLMSNYGSWFNNNNRLGELLLQQLRANGVDTQSATEAMLRDTLKNLVEDNNRLQQELQNFTAMLAQQTQKTQATADAVTQAINMSNPVAGATALPPIDDGQTPPVDAGQMPPVNDEQMPPMDAEQMPPMDDGQMPPVDNEQVPPVDNGQTPPQEQGTVSDERMKDVCYTVSDATLKNIATCFKNSRGAKLNPNFISACNRSI